MRRPRRWDHPTSALGRGLETGTPQSLYRPADMFSHLEDAWQAATPSATPTPPPVRRFPTPALPAEQRGMAPGVSPEEAAPLPPAEQLASAADVVGPPAPPPTKLDALIQSAAEAYGVDPNHIRALIGIESRGNPNAVSNAGALGAMQLMPATARAMGVTDPMDLRQNVMGGVRYFRQMLDQFGDPELAAAAYNAGPTAVRKYGGVPPFRETQNYVAKFRRILGR